MPLLQKFHQGFRCQQGRQGFQGRAFSRSSKGLLFYSILFYIIAHFNLTYFFSATLFSDLYKVFIGHTADSLPGWWKENVAVFFQIADQNGNGEVSLEVCVFS
jgi:hypothetical protein